MGQMIDIEKHNFLLKGKSPVEIVQWTLTEAKRPVLTTNFGPYSASILNVVSKAKEDVIVLWIDTGYNTPQTYKYAIQMINMLVLNVITYIPKQTVAHRTAIMGIPEITDSNHELFTDQVKLEPFRRAMNEHQPDFWFTNIRKGQTAFRNTLDVLSIGSDGVIKVSPFYHYSDEDLDEYLKTHNLPNEKKYYDPTKALSNRECGLHTLKS